MNTDPRYQPPRSEVHGAGGAAATGKRRFWLVVLGVYALIALGPLLRLLAGGQRDPLLLALLPLVVDVLIGVTLWDYARRRPPGGLVRRGQSLLLALLAIVRTVVPIYSVGLYAGWSSTTTVVSAIVPLLLPSLPYALAALGLLLYAFERAPSPPARRLSDTPPGTAPPSAR